MLAALLNIFLHIFPIFCFGLLIVITIGRALDAYDREQERKRNRY